MPTSTSAQIIPKAKGHEPGSQRLQNATTDKSPAEQPKDTLPAGSSVLVRGVMSASTTTLAQKGQSESPFILDPRKSTLVQRWDLTMLLALAFTAIVTPVEVAFLYEGQYLTPLWFVNRLVDIMFIIDIVLTFNLGYLESKDKGGHWVLNRKMITRRYLSSWFIIDFVSVVPFFLVTFDYDDPWGNNAEVQQRTAASSARAGTLVRVVKLLRMLKLARILKATRVLQRNIIDIALHRWEITYALLRIAKLVCILVFYAHLQACVWGLISSFLPAPTWITEFDASFADLEGNGAQPDPMDRYAAALYWSVMTLTSIGYGEMTPVNTTERWLCSLYMMISGMIWTYAIGSVAAIATNLNPNRVLYETTMDQLTRFMRERALPKEMRFTLRDFFESARLTNQIQEDGQLLDKMSPLLQGSVALAANQEWVSQIWFFRGLETVREGVDFVAALAKSLYIRNFVLEERIPLGQMCILHRGLVVKNWRFLTIKKVWGEDMILENKNLMDHSQAVALCYVEVFTLRRFALLALCEDYPIAQAAVSKACRRITMQRALILHLVKMQGRQHGPRSFVIKDMSNGAEHVDEKEALGTIVDRTAANVETLLHLLKSDGLPAGRNTSFGSSKGRTAVDSSIEGQVSELKQEVVGIKDMLEKMTQMMAAGSPQGAS